MKKFTISAVMAMGVVVLSSAAFAGTTAINYRGIANVSALAADTVVPNDTVVPEQKDTVKTDPIETDPVKNDPVQLAFSDTVLPSQKDTVVPQKQTEGESTSFADTVVPADTLTPARSPLFW